ncbi:MAG: cytochrome b/b6 domain-containing protein [Proteobacteria bacterium]|nr:cytochrome b/b6 domain-containing protein [Pseudomonadota bacterium]
MQSIRVWDLPTRLFHWLLALAVVALVVSAKIGGNAMNLHLRLGYGVFALLLFRLAWGVVGGRWSRFASFVPTPARLRAYLKGHKRIDAQVGHNPLGALSVLAMLAVLSMQVGTGLLADDEIAYAGPLAARASEALVKLASHYHTGPGQILVLALVALHVLAIIAYAWRGHALVRPMISGDKTMAQVAAASRDTAGTRAFALVLLALSAAGVYAVVRWGGAASFG